MRTCHDYPPTPAFSGFHDALADNMDALDSLAKRMRPVCLAKCLSICRHASLMRSGLPVLGLEDLSTQPADVILS